MQVILSWKCWVIGVETDLKLIQLKTETHSTSFIGITMFPETLCTHTEQV